MNNIIRDSQDEAALNLFVAMVRSGFTRPTTYQQMIEAGIPRTSVIRAAACTQEGESTPGDPACPLCRGGFDGFACNSCKR
jgi:hypothetical protein